MDRTIDDETLIAFLDGELDESALDRVEAALPTEPEAVRALCELQRSAIAMRAVLDEAAADNLPALQPPTLRPGWQRVVAVAAMLALALTTGLTVGSYNERQDLAARQQAARADEAIGSRTLQVALENNISHATAEWRNPDSGTTGTVTPVRTYLNAQEQYCREYEVTRAAVDGIARVNGVACRENTGEWRVRAVYY